MEQQQESSSSGDHQQCGSGGGGDNSGVVVVVWASPHHTQHLAPLPHCTCYTTVENVPLDQFWDSN